MPKVERVCGTANTPPKKNLSGLTPPHLSAIVTPCARQLRCAKPSSPPLASLLTATAALGWRRDRKVSIDRADRQPHGESAEDRLCQRRSEHGA
jgi:hypothetical protein